jgi:branched-chain amino acid transport system permease protein
VLERRVWTPLTASAAGIVALAFVAAPFVLASPYYGSLIVATAIAVIMTLSLNVLVGTSGQFSLAHVTFFGVGAYVPGILAVHYGLSPWLGLPVALALAALLALTVGVPLLRLQGFFLAAGSLAFSLFVEVLVRQSTGVAGGAYGVQGIPAPHLFGIAFEGVRFVPLAGLAAVAVVVVLINMRHAPLGRALVAVRDNSDAAAACGMNPARIRLIAFVLAASIAALGGWLQAFFFRTLEPHLFSADLTFTWLFMVLIGGVGTIGGVVAGTVVLSLLPQLLGIANVQEVLVLGVLILLVVLFAPRGLAGALDGIASAVDRRQAPS